MAQENFADQTILGKETPGAKTIHDQAMHSLASMRSGAIQEGKFVIAAIQSGQDMSLLTPAVVDGIQPKKLFQKDGGIKRAHLVIIRFDKDIIVRFNDGDPIEVFVADGGILQEEVLEVTKIQITTLSTNTTVRIRLS